MGRPIYHAAAARMIEEQKKNGDEHVAAVQVPSPFSEVAKPKAKPKAKRKR